MADSTIKTSGWSLVLDVSEFALVFAMFNRLLTGECSSLIASPGIAKLVRCIRDENLDHDWYQVFNLDDCLIEESDHNGLQELSARSIHHIQAVGWLEGVPTTFYESFRGARFAPPFPNGTHWRAVAWPFVQVAMVPMLRQRLDTSWPFLKALGW